MCLQARDLNVSQTRSTSSPTASTGGRCRARDAKVLVDTSARDGGLAEWLQFYWEPRVAVGLPPPRRHAPSLAPVVEARPRGAIKNGGASTLI